MTVDGSAFRPEDYDAETVLPSERPSAPVRPPAPSLSAGAQLGRYKLLEVIGEGGFGVVWRAEQREPVRREVAVKVIKPGMDSAAVLARFEAERQTLALMDHPYVARVYDAGVTGEDSGRPGLPYFVMELVRGEPITVYCDRARLGVRERIGLFIKVCEAVQHAHTKAIIHRDIKPTNVLVLEQGSGPTPKVIDFGVAKAVAGPSGGTLLTEAGSMIGTPEYMSPEQASAGPLDVDTRSDVYSLGVTLYELLTGERPFDLRDATLMEVQRVIHEQEPARPSTRVATSTSAPATAARGYGESRSLARVLRSDLDWIVMRCLEKDRARRYGSASALAEDLSRYLADEPVLAGPPSAAYRTRKFVRRHRAGVVASGMVGATVLAAVFLVCAGLVREAGLRRQAEIERDAAAAMSVFLRETLAGVKPELARGSEVTVREMLDVAATRVGSALAGRPEVEGRLRLTIGESYQSLSRYAEAERQFREAHDLLRASRGEDAAETMSALNNLGVALHDLGRLDEARTVLEASLARQREILGPADPQTLRAQTNYASLMLDLGQTEEAERLFREVLTLGPESGQESAAAPAVWQAETGLAWAARARGDAGAELPHLQAAYAGASRTLGEDHPETIIYRGNLAQGLVRADRWDEAAALLEGQVARCERIFGPEHADTLIAINNLALLQQDMARFDEAMKGLERLLEAAPRVFEATHPLPATAMVNLAGLCYRTGDLDRAATLLEQATDRFRAARGPEHPDTIDAQTSLAVVLNGLGRFEEAVRIQRQLLATSERVFGVDDPRTLVARSELAAGLRDLGQFEEAATLFAAVIETSRRVLGDGSDQTLMSAYQYAGLLTRMERWEDALEISESIVSLVDRSLPPSHPVALLGHYRLGAALSGLGRREEAEAAFHESWRRLEAVEGISPDWKGYVAEALAELYDSWDRADDAAEWRGRLPAGG